MDVLMCHSQNGLMYHHPPLPLPPYLLLLLPLPQDFGEHGRELISSEIALRLLRLLCGGPEAAAPLLAAYRLPGEAVQQLLQRAVFKVRARKSSWSSDVMEPTCWMDSPLVSPPMLLHASPHFSWSASPARRPTRMQIIPMENVRGRALVEGGALCERRNGRGVDPNRNWAVDWGVKERGESLPALPASPACLAQRVMLCLSRGGAFGGERRTEGGCCCLPRHRPPPLLPLPFPCARSLQTMTPRRRTRAPSPSASPRPRCCCPPPLPSARTSGGWGGAGCDSEETSHA